jgi:hypothetical protein
MDYFTTEWASGDLSDDEADQVLEQYNKYLGALDRTSAVWRFATTISLNDAYLDRVLCDRSKASVQLSLLTGDNQLGYWMTELHYSGAEIADGEEVLKLGLSKRPSEVWYDEFTGSPNASSHAFLLAPHDGQGFRSPGEFRITFESFDFTQKPIATRQLATATDLSVWA